LLAGWSNTGYADKWPIKRDQDSPSSFQVKWRRSI
jgi:hypothetical protein